jgi:protein TonB
MIIATTAPEPYRILAVMEFDYDPLGGEPGGGEGLEAMASMQQPSEPLAEPALELPEEPEPDIADQEMPEIIESLAETADEIIPLPPPPPKETPKPEPKPKPQPAPQAQQSSTSDGIANSDNQGDSLSVKGAGGSGGIGDGQGGYGGGTGKGTADALAAYKAQVRRKLLRNLKYPPSAKNNKIEGVVTMSFVINRQGEVISSVIADSSDFPILDDEAVALIRRVNPLPAFPKEIDLNVLKLTVPIQFIIR